jgi:hypothetical protein
VVNYNLFGGATITFLVVKIYRLTLKTGYNITYNHIKVTGYIRGRYERSGFGGESKQID